MKRIVVLLAIAATLSGANWDGTKGAVTLTTNTKTITADDGHVTNWTTFYVAVQSPSATAVRVTINVGHRYPITRTVDLQTVIGSLSPTTTQAATVTFPFALDEIVAPPTVTLLFDAAVIQF